MTRSGEPGDDCAAFEAAVSDYLDDTLTGEAAAAAAGHFAGCDACQRARE